MAPAAHRNSCWYYLQLMRRASLTLTSSSSAKPSWTAKATAILRRSASHSPSMSCRGFQKHPWLLTLRASLSVHLPFHPLHLRRPSPVQLPHTSGRQGKGNLASLPILHLYRTISPGIPSRRQTSEENGKPQVHLSCHHHLPLISDPDGLLDHLLRGQVRYLPLSRSHGRRWWLRR